MTIDNLTPQEREARHALALAEIRQLEQEQRDADVRLAAMDEADAAAIVARHRSESRKQAQEARAAAVARRAAATEDITAHAIRAGRPGLTPVEQANEEALALEAVRRAEEWRAIEQRMSLRLQVTEPEVYGPTSPHSYFRDLAAVRSSDPQVQSAALERLAQYGRHLAGEIERESKVGARALRAFRASQQNVSDRERAGHAVAQLRAMSTAGASGGALVTPSYLVDDAALYRSPAAVLWQNCTTPGELPAYGMQVEVPRFTGPADAGTPAENAGPTETDPTAQYDAVPVSMHVGIVTASQQLHDRGGPAFDRWLFRQMGSQLDADIDGAVITAALTSPNTITRTSASLTLPQWLSDVGQAAAKLQTTAGVALPPSAVVAAGAIGEWLLAQVDTALGPWFPPSRGERRSGAGDSGQAVSGVPFLIDQNIPAASGNAQLAVLNRAAITVYTGAEIPDVLEIGGGAGNLSVTYRLRRYVAVHVAYAKGVSVISGSGYPAAPTWA